MAETPTQDLVLAAMAGLETTWAFSAFNPSIFTIQHFAASSDQIRKGYIYGTVFSLGFAGFVSYLMWRTGSRLAWMPVAVAALLSVAFMVVYEEAMRSPT